MNKAIKWLAEIDDYFSYRCPSVIVSYLFIIIVGVGLGHLIWFLFCKIALLQYE